jgi:nucleoside-diphosphate-sugar epimerase
MSQALVTGGGGFLGLYIVEQLVARGDTVRVLCRGTYARLVELGVECISGDIREPASVARACSGIDTVFHVAAVSGIWGSWQHYYGINTHHCRADESLPYPAKYLCHYPRSKALAEQAVLAANGAGGLATTALRPHLIWGPRDNHLIPRLIARAKAGKLRRVGPGDNLISMSYVENAAHAHILAAMRLAARSPVAGQAYFINEPEPVNLWQWIDGLLSLAGLPPVQKSISRRTAYAAGAMLETAYRALRLAGEPPMTRFLAQQLGGTHYYDIGKAARDFDYKPIVSVAEGLQRLQRDLKDRVI